MALKENRLPPADELFWRWRYAKYVTGASVATSPLWFVPFDYGYSECMRREACAGGWVLGQVGKDTVVRSADTPATPYFRAHSQTHATG